jgi:hypothetical protein
MKLPRDITGNELAKALRKLGYRDDDDEEMIDDDDDDDEMIGICFFGVSAAGA